MDLEKSKKLNTMVNNLVNTIKKDSFEQVLQDFLAEELDILMAETFIGKYKRAQKIDDLEVISTEKQVAFAQNMIQHIFTRLRDPKQMNLIQLHFYSRLSIRTASKKIAQSLNQPFFMEISQIKKMSPQTLVELVEKVDKEAFLVKASVRDVVNATAYLFLFKQCALGVAQVMSTRTAENAKESSVQFDEHRIAAVRKFMHTLFDSYTNTLGEYLGEKLTFNIFPLDPFDKALAANDIKEECSKKGEHNIEKLFSAKVTLQIEGYEKFDAVMFLLLENVAQAVKKQ